MLKRHFVGQACTKYSKICFHRKSQVPSHIQAPLYDDYWAGATQHQRSFKDLVFFG